MSRRPSYVGQMIVEFAQVVVVFSVLHGWEDSTAGQLRQILHRQSRHLKYLNKPGISMRVRVGMGSMTKSNSK